VKGPVCGLAFFAAVGRDFAFAAPLAAQSWPRTKTAWTEHFDDEPLDHSNIMGKQTTTILTETLTTNISSKKLFIKRS
jgi:hypothetical protein